MAAAWHAVLTAPFLALAWVDFAPRALLDEPVALSTVVLGIFVLSWTAPAAAVAAAVWLVHGQALRIRAPVPPEVHQRYVGASAVRVL